MFYDQSAFDLRCEWGLPGVRLVGGADCVTIVVDALSFSTCVDVAASRGAAVYPYRWKDESAKSYADGLGAELAGSRGEPGRYSLSPVSLMKAAPGERIVLPSPNGSTLTREAESLGGIVIAGCFRNGRAVARYAASLRKPIAVIACGERWTDDTLRPAVEDFAAAGAIIDELPGSRSPEAAAAVAVWNNAKNDIDHFLAGCTSGRELIERGFEADVVIAAAINVSTAVPVLQGGGFIDARPSSP